MKKKTTKKMVKKDMTCNPNDCKGGCTYGLGALGAAIYYISTATGFWVGVLGILKALVWPVFLVLEVLKFIGA